ncbi:RluA family pseudouridine synthase [Candidatus Peregrinibacteria bacterium]|nr:RluA family pseudouridine synthase [Candidatus Peregrinibacteria bacterium]
MSFKFKVDTDGRGMRVDKFLTVMLPQFSRSYIQNMFDESLCFVNGSIVRKNFILRLGDDVLVKKRPVLKKLAMKPTDIKFLVKNDDYFVIDKTAGIVVEGSVRGENSICDYLSGLLSEDFVDKERPGIVHRLDRWTSGCLLVARNQNALEYFQKQFRLRKIKKIYFALVKGILTHKKGMIDSPIGRDSRDRKKMSVSSENSGRVAISKFEVVTEYLNCSLVKVEILTGRTHQIRVHMQAIGHPVVGDVLYGDRKLNATFKSDFGLERQFLHAHVLEFADLRKKWVKVVSELPEDLQNVIEKLKCETV